MTTLYINIFDTGSAGGRRSYHKSFVDAADYIIDWNTRCLKRAYIKTIRVECTDSNEVFEFDLTNAAEARAEEFLAEDETNQAAE